MAEISEKMKKKAASPLFFACAATLTIACFWGVVSVWMPGSLLRSFARTVLEFFHVKAALIRYGTWINVGRTLLLACGLPVSAALALIGLRLPHGDGCGVRLLKIALTVLSVLATAVMLLAEAFQVLEMIVALAVYKDYTVALRFLPPFLGILLLYILWLTYAKSLNRVTRGLMRGVQTGVGFDCPLFPVVLSFLLALAALAGTAFLPLRWPARLALGFLTLFFLLWGITLGNVRSILKKIREKTDRHENYMRTYMS